MDYMRDLRRRIECFSGIIELVVDFFLALDEKVILMYLSTRAGRFVYSVASASVYIYTSPGYVHVHV